MEGHKRAEPCEGFLANDPVRFSVGAKSPIHSANMPALHKYPVLGVTGPTAQPNPPSRSMKIFVHPANGRGGSG